DTRDNDCDGATDEGCPCDYKGKIDGVCGNATRDSGGTCQRPGQFEPTETTCDGKDNDCDGSTDEPSKCTQQKPPAEPISCSRGFDETVTVPGFEYKPSSLTVSPGKVVRWKFIHRAAHTTTSGTGFTDPNRGKLWDSGSKSRGDTYCVKFRKRGDYKYFCTFHGAITMSGVVKVR
ncbi:MAG: plastocyanin/azurin family copper-binding protein, partial [Bradymonadaceae bacterium]